MLQRNTYSTNREEMLSKHNQAPQYTGTISATSDLTARWLASYLWKVFLAVSCRSFPCMAGIWLGVSQRYLDWRAGSRYRECDLWHYGLQLLHHCRPGYWACGPGSVDENTNIGACLSCLAKKTADFGFSAFRTLLGARWCKPGFWGGAVKTESDDQILNKAYYDTAMQSLCQASGSGSIKLVAWFRRGPCDRKVQSTEVDSWIVSPGFKQS